MLAILLGKFFENKAIYSEFLCKFRLSIWHKEKVGTEFK